jgi:AcrR family transcriptional regulator
MGRIRGRSSQQTRDESLAAAAMIFAERGFEGASLSSIAEEAGISAAALCHHFGSKRGLYDAVIDRIYGSLAELLASIDVTSPFGDVVEQVYALAETKRDEIRVLLGGIMERGGLDENTRERHMVPLSAQVAARMATIYEVCEADARHALIVLSHLVARFVSNHPDDNARALGVATAAQARCVILDLLVTTGQHLLTRSQTPRA